MSWEQIALVDDVIPTVFPQVGPLAAGTRFRVLVPENITRGVVTLERIRGHIYIRPGGALTLPPPNRSFKLQIHLSPVQNAVIPVQAVLDPQNSADQESNRIIWSRTYDFCVLAQGENFAFQLDPVVDVKSRRRFDRALWALTLHCRSEPALEDTDQVRVDLRALFRAPDGL